MAAAPAYPRAGPVVALRAYSAGFSDAELAELYRWACDPELLRLTSGVPLDIPFVRFRELFLSQLPKYNSLHDQLFAILDHSDRLIGRVGLFGIDRVGGSAELGVLIGDPADRGRGYGREAVAAMVDHAFEGLGLSAITLHTYPDNLRAQHAFAAVGFRTTRQLRRFTLDRGTHDELEMRITPADRRAAFEREPPPTLMAVSG